MARYPAVPPTSAVTMPASAAMTSRIATGTTGNPSVWPSVLALCASLMVRSVLESCGRRLACLAVRSYESRNSLECPEVVEVEVVDLDSHAELLFELKQQLDELERIENAGLEEIGVRRRHVDMKALDEQGAEPLDDGVCLR